MKRYFCIIALFAVLLIPDWASACWRWWGGPTYQQSYYARSYNAPIYYYPPVYCPPPAYQQPMFVVPSTVPSPMQPPRVVPGKGKSDSSRTDPSRPLAVPMPAPDDTDPVRPAANSEVNPPAKP